MSMSNNPTHYIGYHGTSDIQKAIKACYEGMKPGSGNHYGIGVYATAHLTEAQSYSIPGGAILRFHINVNTPYKDYEILPGNTPDEKRIWTMSNFNGFIFIREKGWYLFYGYPDMPVYIPGLDYVYLLDYYGNKL